MQRRTSNLIIVTLVALSSLLLAASAAAELSNKRFPQGSYESRFNLVGELVEVRAGNTLVVEDQTGLQWIFNLNEGMQATYERKSLFSARKRVDVASLDKGQQLRLRLQTTSKRVQSITVLTSETIPPIPGQGLGYKSVYSSSPSHPVQQ